MTHLTAVSVDVPEHYPVGDSPFDELSRLFVVDVGHRQLSAAPAGHVTVGVVGEVEALERFFRPNLDRSAAAVVRQNEDGLVKAVLDKFRVLFAVVFKRQKDFAVYLNGILLKSHLTYCNINASLFSPY